MWVGALVVLAVLIALDRFGLLLAGATSDYQHYHGRSAAVTRIIDAATIEVAIEDLLHDRPVTRVRLLGVAAPMLDADAARDDTADDAVTPADVRSMIEHWIAGNPVTLELETSVQRDAMGRVLAHVRLSDASLLNRNVLAAGLGRLDELTPHGRLIEYAQAARAAPAG